MKNQNLLNRLNQLEIKHKDSFSNENLIKFLESLPAEDKEKISYSGGEAIFFQGNAEDWKRIILPFGNTGKIIFIEDFTNDELRDLTKGKINYSLNEESIKKDSKKCQINYVKPIRNESV
ncbi:hypothetical protein [Clostridium sp.]|uniref:hypothetical protein n=1 Tax=Clostridium sp. TaxID=1506 RepID=UPI0028497692|nr:hypothetical protein [Clostridium sp.]MDR3596495.1 hypothetical protein [Clostridium sp.]